MNISFIIRVNDFINAGRIESVCKELNLDYEVSNIQFKEDTKETLVLNTEKIPKKVEVKIPVKLDPKTIKIPTKPVKKKKSSRKGRKVRRFTPETYQVIVERICSIVQNKPKTIRQIHSALNGEFGRPYNTISGIMKRHENELWISELKEGQRWYLAV